MGDEKSRSIADNQRSPAADKADEVEAGPPATNPDDERRPEPPGTAEGSDKTDPDGKPVVPPSRGVTH
jgi:hypothetical protein